jgi:hypothetical protein
MKHAALGACLGWIAAAGYSDCLWFCAVAAVLSLCYLERGLRQGRHARVPPDCDPGAMHLSGLQCAA